MVDEGRESSEGQILTHALLKLRMRDGLVPARLDPSHQYAKPLLRLPAVGEDPAAALDAVRDCVRRMMPGTHQIVADATLALALFTEAYSTRDVPDKVIRDLHSNALGRRRAALLNNWHRLHEALDLAAGPAPSDRTLRETVELRVLRQLAHELLQGEPPEVGTPVAPRDMRAPREPESRAAGRLVVIGGAVMDAMFRAKLIPPHETSGQARDFQLTPGGKGLWQAVAAAKLGLEVALISAIGDDQFGQEIIDYLQAEHVDTSLIKVVRGARTPVTGVIELDLGNSIALVWRNEPAVSLTVRDVERLSEQVTNCDALLLTFEIPRETAQRVLALAHSEPDSRPVVIVTPGQPYTDEGISRTSLRLIDYLVPHAWELEHYHPSDLKGFDPDHVADHLLSRGIGTVCFLGNGGGTIYSDGPTGSFRLPSLSSLYKESSTARDAFCAALAARLIEGDRTFSQSVATWATAAMACVIESPGIPHSLPDRRRIEHRLTTLS